MPIYEYGCDKCGHEFEAEQRITDAPLKTCPECRSRKVRRLISRTSFVLKGGGWYSDLYSSSGTKKADSAPEGGGDKASSDTKSDKKPDGESSGSGASDSASKVGSSKPTEKPTEKGPKAAA